METRKETSGDGHRPPVVGIFALFRRILEHLLLILAEQLADRDPKEYPSEKGPLVIAKHEQKGAMFVVLHISTAALEDLAHREKQILRLALKDASRKEMAHELKVSERTIETYCGRLCHHCGAKDMETLVRRLECLSYDGNVPLCLAEKGHEGPDSKPGPGQN